VGGWSRTMLLRFHRPSSLPNEYTHHGGRRVSRTLCRFQHALFSKQAPHHCGFVFQFRWLFNRCRPSQHFGALRCPSNFVLRDSRRLKPRAALSTSQPPNTLATFRALRCPFSRGRWRTRNAALCTPIGVRSRVGILADSPSAAECVGIEPYELVAPPGFKSGLPPRLAHSEREENGGLEPLALRPRPASNRRSPLASSFSICRSERI
jgi:hypothetical protein